MINNIMDKCVLRDIANGAYEVLNKARERERLIDGIKEEIKTYTGYQRDESLVYSRNRLDILFGNYNHIDTNSSIYIDFKKRVATTNILSIKNASYNITINEVDVTNEIKSGASHVLNVKDVTIRFDLMEEVKDIAIDITASNSYMYILIGDGVNLGEGEDSGSLHCSIPRKIYKEIVVKLLFKKAESVSLRNILLYNSVKASSGMLTGVPKRLYGSTAIIPIEVEGNGYRAFLGLENKNGNIAYFDANTPVVLDRNSIHKASITVDSDIYGSKHKGLYILKELSSKANQESTKVYRGYGMYRETLIHDAFVSEDLSTIDYGEHDIVREGYIDIDTPSLTMSAGDLFILTQTIYADKTIIIKEPIPKGGPHFRWRLTVNGDVLKNQNGNMQYEMQKGINNLELSMYLYKDKDDSDYIEEAQLMINFRQYSNLIYDYKLLPSHTSKALEFREFFAISEDKVLVKEFHDNDRYLVVHEDYIESIYHFRDGNRQYVLASVRVLLTSEVSSLNRIYII